MTKPRDLHAEIRQRNERATIRDLRRIYGAAFAAGFQNTDSLALALDRAGVRSLSEYLKRQP